MAMEKKQTRITYRRKDLEIAKSLLHGYGSLKPMKYGGKKLNHEDKITALETFNARTGHQINEGTWTKLCSRLRSKELERSENLIARPNEDEIVSDDHDAERLSLGGKQNSEKQNKVSLGSNDNVFKSEASDEIIPSPKQNPAEISPCNDLNEHEKELSSQHQGTTYEELFSSSIAATDICIEEEDLAKKRIFNKKNSVDDQELSNSLEDLNLQIITIGEWILVQRASFDIHVKDEPYHSIQIYANLETKKYIRRVWGISESSGELKTMEDLRDLCIATFNKSVVCLGCLSTDPSKDLGLVEVLYPFKRWISGSCLIRYAQGQGCEAIGICSECSGGVAKINKISFKKEISSDLITNEVQKQDIKCNMDFHNSVLSDVAESSNIEMERRRLGRERVLNI